MKKLITFLVVAVLAVSTYISDLQRPLPNELIENSIVHFINVGQGDSSLIITGDQAILIDGGGNSKEEFIVDFIKSQGISKIDLVIGTHSHEDHIGGLDAVLENFTVTNLLMPDVPANTRTYEDVITAANQNNVNLIYPDTNKIFEFKSGLMLKIIPPSKNFESSNTNNDSIVCVVEIGQQSILYTGDMERELELDILSRVPDVDILKVAHHGSSSSSTEEFLNRAKPEISIISCGQDNKYGHPHKEVTQRLTNINSEVKRTDLEGTITLEFDKIAA